MVFFFFDIFVLECKSFVVFTYMTISCLNSLNQHFLGQVLYKRFGFYDFFRAMTFTILESCRRSRRVVLTVMLFGFTNNTFWMWVLGECSLYFTSQTQRGEVRQWCGDPEEGKDRWVLHHSM